jgi:hypothetical protein
MHRAAPKTDLDSAGPGVSSAGWIHLGFQRVRRPQSTSLSIPSRGVRFFPFFWWATCAGFAIAGLWLDLGVNPIPANDPGLLWLAIATLVGSMIFTDLLLEEYFSNRWIEISPSGVTGVYRFHRTIAPWSRLKPLSGGLPGQSGFLFDRGKGRRTQLILTYEQLRAIVDYPASPKWVFPPKVAKEIGLAHSS